MRFARETVCSVLAGAACVTAQNATVSNSTVASGMTTTHVIQVGDANGTLAFSPSSITAAEGDVVQFHFYPMNHSVARSTFDSPCMPLEGSANSTGFWTGFMPVTAESTTMPVFSMWVNDTAPIWFYCATGKHCQNGMAGVINPPSNGKTLDQYLNAAKSVAQSGIPSGGVSGGSSSGGSGNSDGSSGSSDSTSGTTASGSAAVPTQTDSFAMGISVPKRALYALLTVGLGASVML